MKPSHRPVTAAFSRRECCTTMMFSSAMHGRNWWNDEPGWRRVYDTGRYNTEYVCDSKREVYEVAKLRISCGVAGDGERVNVRAPMEMATAHEESLRHLSPASALAPGSSWQSFTFLIPISILDAFSRYFWLVKGRIQTFQKRLCTYMSLGK
jgi:hypothetical protein